MPTVMKISKRSINGPLRGESTGHRWIPITKGQWCGKRFHVMTSSWNCSFPMPDYPFRAAPFFNIIIYFHNVSDLWCISDHGKGEIWCQTSIRLFHIVLHEVSISGRRAWHVGWFVCDMNVPNRTLVRIYNISLSFWWIDLLSESKYHKMLLLPI